MDIGVRSAAKVKESAATKTKESAATKTKESAATKTKESAATKTKESAATKTKESAATKSKESAATKTKESAATKTKESAATKSKESAATKSKETAAAEDIKKSTNGNKKQIAGEKAKELPGKGIEPQAARDDTKQRIKDISLSMFALKGYSAVSIRDICGAVGIKESSVYYHFQNKRAILEAIKEDFLTNTRHWVKQIEMKMLDNITEKEFFDFCDDIIDYYLLEPRANQFLRVILIEQAGDQELRELRFKWIADQPLLMVQKVFEQLMKKGFLKECDSAYLALKYHAPIHFYFHRYLTCGELEEECIGEFKEKVKEHTYLFLNENKKAVE